MKIIKNKWIPFKGYKAINVFGIVFTKKQLSDIDINHEAIHTKQMQELLYIGFYILYGMEYLIKRLLNLKDSQNKVYHSVSFEQEAYNNEKDLIYLKNRKHYAWFKLI